MALPTATEFKARHPRFTSVSDVTVGGYLAEAGRRIDATKWVAGDYADGVMFLAAHNMLTEEVLGAAAAGNLRRVEAGKAKVEYVSHAIGGTDRLDALFGTTVYGRQYLALRDRNELLFGPSILVV